MIAVHEVSGSLPFYNCYNIVTRLFQGGVQYKNIGWRGHE